MAQNAQRRGGHPGAAAFVSNDSHDTSATINGRQVRHLTRAQADLRAIDLTGHGLARLLGVTPRAVQRWRAGTRRPRPVNGFRLWLIAAMVRRIEDRTLNLLCDLEGRP